MKTNSPVALAAFIAGIGRRTVAAILLVSAFAAALAMTTVCAAAATLGGCLVAVRATLRFFSPPGVTDPVTSPIAGVVAWLAHRSTGCWRLWLRMVGGVGAIGVGRRRRHSVGRISTCHV